MRTLNAVFGRNSVGADAVDVQLVHRTTEQRMTVAASCIFIVYTEHAGLVAVKRRRLKVLLVIVACGFKVGEVDPERTKLSCIMRLVASFTSTSNMNARQCSSNCQISQKLTDAVS